MENASEDVTIQITKASRKRWCGVMNLYLCVIMEAQLSVICQLPKWTPTQSSPGGKLAAEKLFSYLTCWRALRWYLPADSDLMPYFTAQQNISHSSWIWSDTVVYVVECSEAADERLHNYLHVFYQIFKGEPTMHITDGCSTTKTLTNKINMPFQLAFSGLHAQQWVWVLTQKCNSILKDLHEQTHWVALFHSKVQDFFEDCSEKMM